MTSVDSAPHAIVLDVKLTSTDVLLLIGRGKRDRS